MTHSANVEPAIAHIILHVDSPRITTTSSTSSSGRNRVAGDHECVHLHQREPHLIHLVQPTLLQLRYVDVRALLYTDYIHDRK